MLKQNKTSNNKKSGIRKKQKSWRYHKNVQIVDMMLCGDSCIDNPETKISSLPKLFSVILWKYDHL